MKQYVPGKLRSSVRTFRRLWGYWIDPVVPLTQSFAYLAAFVKFSQSWFRYRRLPGAETLRIRDSHPCLFDNADLTSYDPHYFYQAVWAMERIARTGARLHIDIGSDIDFVGLLTTHVPVAFLDIRPLATSLPRLHCASADILNLPFSTHSVKSLSCLHVAEHIGLGRYGDPLDPQGTMKAARELSRVLAPGGNLYFAVPVGKPRLCFNAHRVHAADKICEYFANLELVEFSGVHDNGRFVEHTGLAEFRDSDYACAMFWFKNEGRI